MNISYLLEKHHLGRAIFPEINRCFTDVGIFLKHGMVVDRIPIKDIIVSNNW